MENEGQTTLEEYMNGLSKQWSAVLKAYEDLKEKHKVFCMSAERVDLDQAGPGLREALQRLFHKRRFGMFLEDLLYEDFRKGGLSQLVPPVLQEKQETQPKVPPSFRGNKKDAPTVE